MFSVHLYDSQVGVIERRGRGIRFTYTGTILGNENVHALSISLPKRSQAYPNRQGGVFFRNLLPEQAYKRLVARAAGTTPENNLALLGAIGGECPGAVSIWPEGRHPPRVSEYQPLTDADLKAHFTPSASATLASAIARGRLSLPGVQEKIALLRREDGTWTLPLNGAVTSHILKHPTEEFAGLLENELFCMALARSVGLEVPDSGRVSRDLGVLWIERFDRVTAGSSSDVPRYKLHQEDFCQALKVEPESKYESDGGPGIAACAAVIGAYSSLPASDLPRMVRWVGFNYVIGNEDAHAKNLAFLYTHSGLRLTPHYDLVSTEVYPGLERSLAMKIGRSWDIRNVQRSDWRLFGQRVGLPWDTVRALLLEVVDSATTGTPDVVRRCVEDYGAASIYSLVGEVVERRAEQLTGQLTLH